MTAQELIDPLREVDADCVEDLIIVKSATDSFTMKIILVTE